MSGKCFFTSVCNFFSGLFSSDTTVQSDNSSSNTDGLTGVERYIQNQAKVAVTSVEQYIRNQTNTKVTSVEQYIRNLG